MTLGALVSAARTLAPDARARVEQARARDREVTGIAHDSRAVAPGTVFVAIRGHRMDAVKFVPDAVSRGAVAIVSEAGIATAKNRLSGDHSAAQGLSPNLTEFSNCPSLEWKKRIHFEDHKAKATNWPSGEIVTSVAALPNS